jgi:hypothetical protein
LFDTGTIRFTAALGIPNFQKMLISPRFAAGEWRPPIDRLRRREAIDEEPIDRGPREVFGIVLISVSSSSRFFPSYTQRSW